MLVSKNFEFDLDEDRKIEVTLRVTDVEEREVETMGITELEAYLCQLRKKLDEIEGDEPDNEDSEEYEDWEEEYDQLEDLIDDAEERLSALRG